MKFPFVTEASLKEVKSQVDLLVVYQKECLASHESNNLLRRQADKDMLDISNTLKASHDTNKEILDMMKTYLPTLKRSQERYSTEDTVKGIALYAKEVAIWIAALAAGGGGIHYWAGLLS